MDLLDQVDLALNQITTYFESHVELEEEEVFLSLASFLDLDDLEDNRTLIEQAFEFDAPKFCDLIIWASKVDLFGLEAYYETPSERRLNEKWFRQVHLDHEYDEIYEPVNLLLMHESLEKEDDLLNGSNAVNQAISFLNDFPIEDDDDVKTSNGLVNFERTKRKHKLQTSCSNSVKVPPFTSNDSQPPNYSILKPSKPKLLPDFQMLRRNITSRVEKENRQFLQSQDANPTSKLTRVDPSVCQAPSDSHVIKQMAPVVPRIKPIPKKEVRTEDIRDLLLAQHTASKQLRVAKQQQQQAKANALKQNARKEETEILSLLKQHNHSANSKKHPKEEDELISLLQKHNLTIGRKR